MKLCVTCLARTDMTPRQPRVASAVDAAELERRAETRERLDSLFETEEEELPTTLYRPSPRSRTRVRTAAASA